MPEVAEAAPAAPPVDPVVAPVEPPAQPAAPAAAWDATKYNPSDVSTWPPEAQATIRDLRSENATRRTKLTQSEQEHQAALDGIAKALGLKPSDDPAAAAQTAAAERDAALAAAKQVKVENAVLRMAAKHGASAEALTDSRSFMAKLEALDPAADDFAAQVESAITASVEANPSLKMVAPPAAPPARSGGPVGGGTPPAGQLTAEDVARMRAEGKDAEIVKAKAEGRLNHLLGID